MDRQLRRLLTVGLLFYAVLPPTALCIALRPSEFLTREWKATKNDQVDVQFLHGNLYLSLLFCVYELNKVKVTSCHRSQIQNAS